MADWKKLHQVMLNLFEPPEANRKMLVLRRWERSGVKGFHVLTRKLCEAPNKEAFHDLFAEALAAGVFLRNGFGVTFLKAPEPDMRVEDNDYRLFVEVKRIREDYEKTKKIEKKMRRCVDEEKLAIYGTVQDVQKGGEKIKSVVQEALRQLVEGELNLVFLWIDKRLWEELEFLEAMKYVQEEIRGDRKRYSKLSGLIYRPPWWSSMQPHFYFWKNPAETMIDEELARRLDKVR